MHHERLLGILALSCACLGGIWATEDPFRGVRIEQRPKVPNGGDWELGRDAGTDIQSASTTVAERGEKTVEEINAVSSGARSGAAARIWRRKESIMEGEGEGDLEHGKPAEVAPVRQARPPYRQYSLWMLDSISQRRQGFGLGSENRQINSYEHGTLYHALLELYMFTQNQTYLIWIKRGLDNIINEEGGIVGGLRPERYSLDDLRTGEALVRMYQLTGQRKYAKAAAAMRYQLQNHPRTPEGGFWHKQRYTQQQWLDGLYMAHPFYWLYAETFENSSPRVVEDIGRQFQLVWDHCFDQKTGLLRHGYDYSKRASWADPVTGASPEVWDRAVGWYVMALVDLLGPPSPIPAGRTRDLLMRQLRMLVEGLVKTEIGGWPLVISQPLSRSGNYIETSGTLMFVYAMIKGVRLGFLDDQGWRITTVAARAYETVVRRFLRENRDGTLSLENTVRVGSLDRKADFDYYVGVAKVTNDLKGTAPFVMASLEYERILRS